MNGLTADIFLDKQERILIPSNGWCRVDSNGEFIQDELAIHIDDKGPLKINPDPLGHGNYHTLYNILNSKGEKNTTKRFAI